MRLERISTSVVWVCVQAWLCLLTSASAETRESLLSKLSNVDSLWRDQGTVTYSVLMPLPMGRTGETERLLLRGTLTGRGESWAAVGHIDLSVAVPTYEPPGTSSNVAEADYDQVGRLVLWRKTSFTALSEGNFRGFLDRVARVVVAPDGTAQDGSHSPPEDQAAHVFLDDPVSSIQHREVYIPLLCSGRGYSFILREITHIEPTGDSGLIECEAIGGTPGYRDPKAVFVWKLSVDPGSGYLVRRAECSGESSPDTVFMEFTNDGTIWCEDGPVPQVGHFAFHPKLLNWHRLEYDLTFDGLRAQADEEVFAEAREALKGAWAEETRVHDNRRDRDGPEFRVVGESFLTETTPIEELDVDLDALLEEASSPQPTNMPIEAIQESSSSPVSLVEGPVLPNASYVASVLAALVTLSIAWFFLRRRFAQSRQEERESND